MATRHFALVESLTHGAIGSVGATLMKLSNRTYSIIAAQDETYAVEIRPADDVPLTVAGFKTEAAARAWIMKLDPVKELESILISTSPPEEPLPRLISGPRESSDEKDEIRRFAHITANKAKWDKFAAGSWQLINYWSDSWLRVVLTGCVMGLVVGLLCRAILLPH